MVKVKQGDIIKVDFNPQAGHEQAGHEQAGHEQAGYRPAVVLSNQCFNQKTNLTIVCPITNTKTPFPLHIPLDGRTKTTGVILCEHIKSFDLTERKYTVIETLPGDLLQKIVSVVFSEIRIS